MNTIYVVYTLAAIGALALLIWLLRGAHSRFQKLVLEKAKEAVNCVFDNKELPPNYTQLANTVKRHKDNLVTNAERDVEDRIAVQADRLATQKAEKELSARLQYVFGNFPNVPEDLEAWAKHVTEAATMVAIDALVEKATRLEVKRIFGESIECPGGELEVVAELKSLDKHWGTSEPLYQRLVFWLNEQNRIRFSAYTSSEAVPESKLPKNVVRLGLVIPWHKVDGVDDIVISSANNTKVLRPKN